jgi:glycine/D-amino acid oxidase-like deaminating enzyme
VTTPLNLPVWADEPPLHLPQLAGEHEADACVVGLGGSGLAAVRELLALGCSVIGIDAGPVGGGAAGRNGGFLLAGLASFHHRAAAQHGRPRARGLYRLTLDEIDRIAAETPSAVRRTGSLRIAASEEEMEDCERHLAALRADGFPAESYEGPEGRGVLIPTDGSFHPLRRCRLLAADAIAKGARLYEYSPAIELSGELVRTPFAEVRCRRTIVAVDGNLERLLPETASHVRTARLQMLATAPAPEVRVPRPVYARWGYEYWQQLEDGRVALGGFRDLAGPAEWNGTGEPSAVVQQLLEAFLRERLGVTAPVTHRWAASVAYTPDGLPLLAEVRPGMWVTGAYSGTGNVVGALCGRAAARLAAGPAGAEPPLAAQLLWGG